MKKRKVIYLMLILIVTFVSGCSSNKKYSEAVDRAFEANKELTVDYDGEARIFERNKSNVMVWEDENNYYVYMRKNFSDGVHSEMVSGDGYKLSKNSDRWDSSPKSRAKIMEFLEDNEKPVFEEKNVELVSNDYDMY
ncbi:hypothetical protein P0E64_08730 [Enterococcus faecalis]|uniref:hypothetical protein n=1 Tax=Enterococcus faecalis TaxID=1351 RepID=UPI0025AFC1A1|nr:hypothetical protein [Enterococcus faecalis]MDN3125194.1 hypothetical protein [Enterococcus faecalis]